MKIKRILICGGRDFGLTEKERYFINHSIDTYLNVSDENMLGDHCIIVTGAAKGVDRVGSDYAVTSWKELEEYPANWDLHGRSAGPIRNQQMLATGIDVVLAFPGGRGTDHMKKIARQAGVEVIEYVFDDD